MRPQKIIVSLLAFLVCMSGAAALELTHKAVQDEISWDGTAVFTLNVRNDASSGDTIKLKPSNFLWGDIIFDEPVVSVSSGQVEPVTVRITPPTNVLRGIYDVEVIAISITNPKIQTKDILRVYINSESPHLAADFGIPSQLAPTEDKFNIILKNTGTIGLSGLTASLNSELLPAANMNVGDLGAGEASLVWDQSVAIPANTKPGNYDVILNVFKDGINVGRLKKVVEILGKAKVVSDESVAKGFLSETHVIELQNIGNIPIVNSYLVDVPGWKRLFMQTTPKAVVSGYGSVAEFAWPYKLGMEETTKISYTISYVPLLAAVLAALVMLYALGWYYRQEFTITKEVFREDDTKSMRIKLTVRNHAPLVQSNIIVEDSVPTPLKLTKEFATMQPTLIKRQAGAMKVLWKFGTIYPGEERVLAYNVKSSLPLIGNFVLPEAKVRVRIDKKLPKQYLSNRVTVEGMGVKVEEPAEVD